jgi:hypothetical protein
LQRTYSFLLLLPHNVRKLMVYYVRELTERMVKPPLSA